MLKNVGWLDVALNDSFRVRRIQTTPHEAPQCVFNSRPFFALLPI
jgi:hypothetical protein